MLSAKKREIWTQKYVIAPCGVATNPMRHASRTGAVVRQFHRTGTKVSPHWYNCTNAVKFFWYSTHGNTQVFTYLCGTTA